MPGGGVEDFGTRLAIGNDLAIEAAEFRGLIAEVALAHELAHVLGHDERIRCFIIEVGGDVLNNRLVHIPTDEVDGGQRCHGAARVGADKGVHHLHAVGCGELRDFVEDLEADAVACKGGRIGAGDGGAAEAIREDSFDFG